jgi:hypothetical protein
VWVVQVLPVPAQGEKRFCRLAAWEGLLRATRGSRGTTGRSSARAPDRGGALRDSGSLYCRATGARRREDSTPPRSNRRPFELSYGRMSLILASHGDLPSRLAISSASAAERLISCWSPHFCKAT